MKDCGGHFHGKHLKSSLEYILKPEKTQDGRLVGAINCQVDTAFEQMKETKRLFGKIDKRQGYHLILSFKENEVDPDTAMEITQKFVQEYLGKEYEAVYAVHDNTEHVHSHIVFNSVSFVSGKKYRYEKGDWARDIQPITNRLCEEYGLSIIDIEEGKGERANENYNCNHVVASLGVKPFGLELVKEIKTAGYPTIVIGDASGEAKISGAVLSGYNASHSI